MPKEGIHPKYATIHVKCACGNSFETRSTYKGELVVEICAACHPFFTGKQKLVDTAGRVERCPPKGSQRRRRKSNRSSQSFRNKAAAAK